MFAGQLCKRSPFQRCQDQRRPLLAERAPSNAFEAAKSPPVAHTRLARHARSGGKIA
jgi:hypothetical protein